MRAKSIHVLACVVLLALFSTTSLTQNNTHYKDLPNFHQVNETLFRGGQPTAGGFEQLKQWGIKSVVNLRKLDERAHAEEAAAQRAGLRYFHIPLGTVGRPEHKDIEQALSVINNVANQPVFVHCRKGQDRTGVVIAAYRIAQEDWTSEQAMAEAQRHGMKLWQIGMKNYIRDFYVLRHLSKNF